MTTAAEHGLVVQAWWGDEPYDARRIYEGGWPKDARHKPDGRFFTSSWEGHTSARIDYQASTARAAEARSVQLFLPDPEAVLYVIDSPDDYDELVRPIRTAKHGLSLARTGVSSSRLRALTPFM